MVLDIVLLHQCTYGISNCNASLPTLTYTAAGGATSTDYSRTDGFQLYDSDDVTWRVHNLIQMQNWDNIGK